MYNIIFYRTVRGAAIYSFIVVYKQYHAVYVHKQCMHSILVVYVYNMCVYIYIYIYIYIHTHTYAQYDIRTVRGAARRSARS